MTGVLDHLENLLNAATPRPWTGYTGAPGSPESTEFGERYPEHSDGIIGRVEEAADRALIVALVNDAPYLLRLARLGAEALNASGPRPFAENFRTAKDCPDCTTWGEVR